MLYTVRVVNYGMFEKTSNCSSQRILPGEADEFSRNLGYQWRDDLPAVMESADIGVIPSVAQEPLSIIALELMASGCAVAASRIGGLQFSVIDGFTGLLFEPGSIDDLKVKLNLLLDSSETRESLGRAAWTRTREAI